MRCLVMYSAVAFLPFAAGSVWAQAVQPAPGEIHQRFDNQQHRIDQGVASGQLTRAEAARDENHLKADEALRHEQRVKDGGGPLTAAQRARDNRRLNNNSARIYDTKHNAETGVPR